MNKINTPKETVLLLFSGGIDSTYLLYYYLSQTNVPVHVHYISMRYPHIQRWKKEDQASASILQYFRQHYRPFESSDSINHMDAWEWVGMDSNIQLTTAARIAPNLSGELVTVVRGRCAGDILPDPEEETAKVQQRDELWSALHKSITPLHRDRVNSTHYCPLADSNVCKKDIIQTLPAELLSLCWSCRTPEMRDGVLQACSHCHTCQQHRQLFAELDLKGKYPNINPSSSPLA